MSVSGRKADASEVFPPKNFQTFTTRLHTPSVPVPA